MAAIRFGAGQTDFQENFPGAVMFFRITFVPPVFLKQEAPP